MHVTYPASTPDTVIDAAYRAIVLYRADPIRHTRADAEKAIAGVGAPWFNRDLNAELARDDD